jgi:hypothetical protein
MKSGLKTHALVFFVSACLLLVISTLQSGRDVEITPISGKPRARHEVLFVTSIYGTYEKTLKTPAKQTVPARFVAFTDREDLLDSPGWEVHLIKDPSKFFLNASSSAPIRGRNDLNTNTHPFNQAKAFKMQFHRINMLRGHRIAIWMDATVQVTNSSTAQLMRSLVEDNGENLIAFEHFVRSGSLEQEVIASQIQKYTSTQWGCCQQPYQNVTAQYLQYIARGFRERWWSSELHSPLAVQNRQHFGVWITCFVVFDMENPVSGRFLDAWWRHNVRHTTQDQVSFSFLAWHLKIYPYTLPVEGLVNGNANKNSLFIKLGHGIRRLALL